MGGVIGLTFRWSDGSEWRGSCWTNVLPQGLFAPAFYGASSEAHSKAWLARIEAERAAEPDVDELWNCRQGLAPVEYGLVVVDYKTKTVWNHQGYCSVVRKTYFTPSKFAQPDPDRMPEAFKAEGCEIRLLRSGVKRPIMRDFLITSCPAWERYSESLSYPDWRVLDSLHAFGFAVSDTELATWQEYIKERG